MISEGSNLRAILHRVVDAINSAKAFDGPIAFQLGQQEVSSVADAPPSLVFIPLYDDGYRGAHDQPDDAQAYYETTTWLQVNVWGTDLDNATKLRDAFLIACHVLYSPNAFVTGPRGEYSKATDSGEGGMVMIRLTCGFVIPILYETFAAAIIEYATNNQPGGPAATGIIVSEYSDGADPETLPQ